MTLPISEALALAILVLEQIQRAKLSGAEVIEIDDLGKTFAEVNARIQAARSTVPS